MKGTDPAASDTELGGASIHYLDNYFPFTLPAFTYRPRRPETVRPRAAGPHLKSTHAVCPHGLKSSRV